MDAFTTDILAFLKQNVIRKLEAAHQNKHVTHPALRATMVRYFNLGPARHANFEQFVLQTAQILKGESPVVFRALVTPYRELGLILFKWNELGENLVRIRIKYDCRRFFVRAKMKFCPC